MKRPRVKFLAELATALNEAEHKNVAEHLAAGFLWALYPDWFKENEAAFSKERKFERDALEEGS